MPFNRKASADKFMTHFLSTCGPSVYSTSLTGSLQLLQTAKQQIKSRFGESTFATKLEKRGCALPAKLSDQIDRFLM